MSNQVETYVAMAASYIQSTWLRNANRTCAFFRSKLHGAMHSNVAFGNNCEADACGVCWWYVHGFEYAGVVCVCWAVAIRMWFPE